MTLNFVMAKKVEGIAAYLSIHINQPVFFMGWDVYPHLSAPQKGHEMAREGNSGIIETRLQMGAVFAGYPQDGHIIP